MLLKEDVPSDSCLNVSEIADIFQINIITSWESNINNRDNQDVLNDNLMRKIDRYHDNNDGNDDVGDLRSQIGLISGC